MTTIPLDELMALRGGDVYGSDDDRVGRLEQVYVDNHSGEPEWIAVTTGYFGLNLNLIPLEGAEYRDKSSLKVAHDKDTVKDSPNVDPDGELSESEEQELYRYYGLDDSREEHHPDRDHEREGSATGTSGTITHDTSGPETDSVMTRSEEELRVDKNRTEPDGDRVRLRRHVGTEQ